MNARVGANDQAGRRRRRHAVPCCAGFTLLEVLLATALLAAGLALAFATVRAATAVGQRGTALAHRSEHVRAVERVLRQRLAGALPMLLERDPRTGQPLRFIGEPQRMVFVADVPDGFGYGGPYRHELVVSGPAAARRLLLKLVLIPAGPSLEQSALAPQTLADSLQDVRLGYRGIDPRSGALGDWQSRWPWRDQLPALVRIDIRSARGSWPPLLVALPQAGADRVQP